MRAFGVALCSIASAGRWADEARPSGTSTRRLVGSSTYPTTSDGAPRHLACTSPPCMHTSRGRCLSSGRKAPPSHLTTRLPSPHQHRNPANVGVGNNAGEGPHVHSGARVSEPIVPSSSDDADPVGVARRSLAPQCAPQATLHNSPIAGGQAGGGSKGGCWPAKTTRGVQPRPVPWHPGPGRSARPLPYCKWWICT